MAGSGSGFRFPFFLYSEREALAHAKACPNGLFVRSTLQLYIVHFLMI
jgi:hypothetical protein